MARSTTIEPEVRTALASIEWDGEAAKLTCGQLDRKIYTKVNDALEAIGGKWNKKAKAHLFSGNAADELEALIETGEVIRNADIRQLFGEFETPDILADAVIERAGFASASRFSVLEPSAGSGQLLRALSRASAGPAITAVEIQQKHHAQLQPLASIIYMTNFLSLDPANVGTFDRVIMNPPFSKQADVDHVLHAWKFLRNGGRLVAIMSPGWTFRENRKSVAFRSFVQDYGAWDTNPDGSFAAMGTNVNSVLVTLDK